MDPKQKLIAVSVGAVCGLIIVALAVLLVMQIGAMNAAREARDSLEASINSHYAEDITAADCCRRASLSYNYFSSIFKKVTGLNFKDYLNLTRINQAEKELLATDRSITDIAAACGFNNTSYFISTFKKIKNVTPSEMRKAQKRAAEERR